MALIDGHGFGWDANSAVYRMKGKPKYIQKRKKSQIWWISSLDFSDEGAVYDFWVSNIFKGLKNRGLNGRIKISMKIYGCHGMIKPV